MLIDEKRAVTALPRAGPCSKAEQEEKTQNRRGPRRRRRRRNANPRGYP